MTFALPHVRVGAALLLASVACLALASCARDTGKRTVQQVGPITHIEIHKSERRMILYSGNSAVRSFDIGLGFAPVGHKLERGDGKTPVGTYFIDRQNPNSLFHLSLGISYPNEEDRRMAKLRGVDPGDNIFIHGEPNSFRRRPVRDWTDGCIAVSNREMAYIYRTVKVGTKVHIYH